MSRMFTFDIGTQRYRVTSGAGKGQFISTKAVLSLTEGYLGTLKGEVSNITNSLLNQNLSVFQWEQAITKILKSGHANAYMLGRGGYAQMTQQDLGFLGARVKREYQYLRQFAKDIQSGNLSAAQIQARVNQYINTVYSTRALAENKAHIDAGFTWEKDVLGSADHCASCVSISSRGWVEIGSNPPIGVDRDCKSGCRCSKVYDKGESRPRDSLLGNKFGWINGLNKPLQIGLTDMSKEKVVTKSKEALSLGGQYSVMLSLKPDHDLAEAIAIEDCEGCVEAEDLHVTLGYFGKPDQIYDFAVFQRALLDYCLSLPPVNASISGVGRFNASESSNGMDVIYLSISAPGLNKLHTDLINLASQYGLENASSHSFNPHMTLAYVEPGQPLSVSVEPFDMTFAHLTLSIGERDYTFAFDEESAGFQASYEEPEGVGESEESKDGCKPKKMVARDRGMPPTPIVQAIKSKTFGTPTADQLALMNQYRPKNSTPYTSNEVINISIQASHNLMALSGVAWHINSLKKMCELMPGKPFILDHNWENASGTVAFVYDAELEVSDQAPDWMLNQAQFLDVNQQIVDRWGYAVLTLHLCAQAGTPIEDGVRFRRVGDVSTGTLTNATYTCPICNTVFEDDSCPHIPGTQEVLWMAANGELTERQMALIAPYILRDGVFYAVETSAVVSGNLPGAGVISERC